MAKAPALKLPSNEEMKARFHDLGKEVAAIEAKSGPLRAERDKLVNENALKIKAMDEKIKKVEDGLFDIKMERGNLVRLLKGATGEAPE